jgi:hypothetical protein
VAVVMICMFGQYTCPVRGYFDDGKVRRLRPRLKTFPREARGTADPSTSVGMTKGTAALPFKFDAAGDKQQVPPLRYASVGMTLLLGTDQRTSGSSSARLLRSMKAPPFLLPSRL